MQTPIYKFNNEDYDKVYEPAEDSFLLLDTLEEDLKVIQQRQPLVCVEIGPGSGIVITALAQALGVGHSYFLGIDINPDACRMTNRTSAINGCPVEVINMDLLGGVRDDSVDLLVFNPPYVPTSDGSSQGLEEHIGEISEGRHNLVKSWAGGLDGMVVANRVLKDLDRILTKDGVFYLLLVKENKPMDVVNSLAKDGFTGSIIKERKIRGEHLFVIRITRK